jgi:hypothetical protein
MQWWRTMVDKYDSRHTYFLVMNQRVNIYLILLEQQFTGGSSIEKYVVVSSEPV